MEKTGKSRFKLAQFDATKLAATRTGWLSTAEDLGMSPWPYEKALTWAEAHMDYEKKTSDGYAYGIFDDDQEEALAAVDIIHSPRANVGLIKMLEVTMGPKYAPSNTSAETLGEALQVYIDAIIGTIMLTSELPARVIKLYGRDDDLMKLFVGMNYHLSSTPDSALSSKIEGRWLVITAP